MSGRPISGIGCRLMLLACTCWMSGCASVDFDYPKNESFAYQNTRNTELGREVAALGEIPQGHAGFHLLSNSLDALSTRLLLAERAERSIDVQYYLAYADRVGYLSLRSLLAAADRGVRVRVLLDDFLTGGLSEGLAALDTHPLIEVRLYNPFARRSFRLGDFTWDFKRINRRMHNKVMIADNQVSIIGGRNIAEEYFAASDTYNFSDLDVLSVGDVVSDSSQMFDAYWNHRISVPIAALAGEVKDPQAAMEALRQRINAALSDIASTRYQAAIEDSILEYLDGGVTISPWARYQFIYDPPVKPDRAEDEKYATSILTPLRETVNNAEQELVVASPYFVMLDNQIRRSAERTAAGLEFTVITNSLASTNHNIVHSGYGPTRKRLLEARVKLYETRPDVRVSGVSEDTESKSSLHTKAFIADRRWFYLGSFNWDPRSTYINTESGVIIDSPEIAEAVLLDVEARLATAAYEVYLDDENRLRWKTIDTDGREMIYTREPETSWWTRFKVALMSLLPIDEQL